MDGHRKRNTFITEARLCFQFASIMDYSIEVCGAATDLQEHIIIGNRNSDLESKMFKVFSATYHMPIGFGNFWWALWNNWLSGMMWQGLQAQRDGNWDKSLHWYLASPIIVNSNVEGSLPYPFDIKLMWFHDCIYKPCSVKFAPCRNKLRPCLTATSVSMHTYTGSFCHAFQSG